MVAMDAGDCQDARRRKSVRRNHNNKGLDRDSVGHVDACLKHPQYAGKGQPTRACHGCWFLYFQVRGREYFGW